jgi:integrase
MCSLSLFEGMRLMDEWRVFWVPRGADSGGVRTGLLEGWHELVVRESELGIAAGDPIFLAPDHRVDPVLGAFGRSSAFRRYTAETKRNYAADIGLLLTFLWSRGRSWHQARARDLEDFEHWRRFAEGNGRRISGTKWDRELAAFTALYRWATSQRLVETHPVAMRQVTGFSGQSVAVAAARAKDARSSNVHWLTPRTWRVWIDVGLRGHVRGGVPQAGWASRTEDRNVAFVRLLTSSGLRRSEAGSLLTFEVPAVGLGAGRYLRGVLAPAGTRSKRQRTFYVAAEVVGEIEAYVESSRAAAIRAAQRQGRYEVLPGIRVVREVSRGLRPLVHWVDQAGRSGQQELAVLTVAERMLLFTPGPRGPEPLWLWLNERGLPFSVHSWESVFREANQRCERVLTPPVRVGADPHQVFAPYATPHSGRHSFALFMLVVLEQLMDVRYGLSPQERRDFRQLYGDPWFMVAVLLGHASKDTTIKHYLAPVADLQLRSMLAAAQMPGSSPGGAAGCPLPELDAVFAAIADQSDAIQDFGPDLLADRVGS